VHILCYGYFVWFAVVLAPSCRLFVVSIFPLALILGLGTLVPVGTSDASPTLTGSCFAFALLLVNTRTLLFVVSGKFLFMVVA
jgi:hypothetical protein